MGKNSRKRTILYSNVKENKKRAEEIVKIKEQQINLDDEVIIGMNQPKQNNKKKKQNNSSSKKNKNTNKKINKNSTKKNKDIQQNKNMQQSKNKMNPNKKKKIFFIIRLIIILAIIIGGLVFFLKSSFFNISQVNVKIDNNKVLTEVEIKTLSSITIGQNINSVNKKDVIEKIKCNPYVENVKIKKSFPSTIQIIVEERTVAFQISIDNEYLYIDGQGYILEKSAQKNSCMVITGVTTSDLSIGNRLNDDDLKSLEDVNLIIKEAENNNLKDSITSIDIQDQDDYKIYFDNLKKMAHLGNTTSITEKMAYIKKILEAENDYEGEIFVNVDLNNGEYPHFREKV